MAYGDEDILSRFFANPLPSGGGADLFNAGFGVPARIVGLPMLTQLAQGGAAAPGTPRIIGLPQRGGATPAATGGEVVPTGAAAGTGGWTFPVQGYKTDVNLHHGSHMGAADLFAPPGTPVVAARGGTVTGAGFNAIGGNYVSVKGDDGLEYYYAHLDRTPPVRAGQTITPGAYLGGVGDTGNARGTGAHLHFAAGRGIQTGTGPAGGAGIDYDTVGALRSALAAPATRPTAPAAGGGRYQDLARSEATRAGIDPDLFVRQIQQESGFNPQAGNPSGAYGIAQIVPRFHPGVNPADPEASLRYAADLMARHIQNYGDVRTALIAYNGGQGAVDAARAGRPYRESQTYLQRILGR